MATRPLAHGSGKLQCHCLDKQCLESGTTGADQQLNIGTVANGIWLENRFGSAQTFWYYFFT
ncbi:hypothetical protein [Hyphomonas adhaerens]|uniref:hypothetical protein n=1 Tax=Hyphomonas adhaerens TaxID=81029 RepID=UPI00235593E5|nr:hypothetical protein [Hyphomonas adhaerens]